MTTKTDTKVTEPTAAELKALEKESAHVQAVADGFRKAAGEFAKFVESQEETKIDQQFKRGGSISWAIKLLDAGCKLGAIVETSDKNYRYMSESYCVAKRWTSRESVPVRIKSWGVLVKAAAADMSVLSALDVDNADESLAPITKAEITAALKAAKDAARADRASGGGGETSVETSVAKTVGNAEESIDMADKSAQQDVAAHMILLAAHKANGGDIDADVLAACARAWAIISA